VPVSSLRPSQIVSCPASPFREKRRNLPLEHASARFPEIDSLHSLDIVWVMARAIET
jgi:hypothetical protein